jgi:hypothetical protein
MTTWTALQECCSQAEGSVNDGVGMADQSVSWNQDKSDGSQVQPGRLGFHPGADQHQRQAGNNHRNNG